MEKLKNKKILLLLGAIVIFLGIGGTLAYYNSSDRFDNVFNTQTFKTIAIEEFESPTNWKPGDVTPKTIKVKNEGDDGALVYARVCVSDSWVSKNGRTLPNHDDTLDEDIAILVLDNESDWTYSNGCYYYNSVLSPNDETSSPISAVKFNEKYAGDVICTKDSTTNTSTCESSSSDYAGATYTLTLTVDTIQTEGLGEWGIGFSIIGGTNSYNYQSASQAVLESGFNTFLRNTLVEAGIQKEVGFIKNSNEYYLVGGDGGASYENNVAVLSDVFDTCSLQSGAYTCEDDDFYIRAINNGIVIVENYSNKGVFVCMVSSDGNFTQCHKDEVGYSSDGKDRFETSLLAMAEKNHSNYLRYSINDKKYISSVGFKINDNEYYLVGGDQGDSYSVNKETLERAFGSSNCTESADSYICSNEIFSNATALDNGVVLVVERNSGWTCNVDYSGESGCMDSSV